MILFHGSNVTVKQPELRAGLRSMDFGPGFYTTSCKEQASHWARSVTRRRRMGCAIVNVYSFEQTQMQELLVLQFERASEDWLEFVVSNRKNMNYSLPYDLVIGPIANDSTLQVIDDYMEGRYTKNEAINHLLPQNLKDQYAFLTCRSLQLLQFQEALYV